jgi:hypothetical protein
MAWQRCTFSVVAITCSLLVLTGVPVALSGTSADGVRAAEHAGPDQVPAAKQRCGLNHHLVPRCGALWGIYNPIGSTPQATNWTTAITSMERRVGRRFGIVKRYHDFSNSGSSGAFPDSHERMLARRGRIPFIAWVSSNYSTGADMHWPAIAAGDYDASVIDPVARRLERYGKRVFLDFDHEMDGRFRAHEGTPADYVRAYRHIVQRFRAIGATNVIFVWTTTGWLGNEEKIRASYPGDAYVDWVAYDPYNFAACHKTAWRGFGGVVDDFYDWAMVNGHSDKPLMLAEYGTVPDPDRPRRRAQWFRGQLQGMKAHPRIKAVIYFNSQGSCPAHLSASISHDRPALRAFEATGQRRYFRPRG